MALHGSHPRAACHRLVPGHGGDAGPRRVRPKRACAGRKGRHSARRDPDRSQLRGAPDGRGLGAHAVHHEPRAALRHFWIVAPLAFFILFSNLLGLVPGFLPPTESFNTTFACGAIVFLYYNIDALRRMGFGHIAHMANPVGEPWGWILAPLFLPVELISHCIRPVSLSVRLLCNIAGDHLVLGVFVGIAPFLLPIPFMALGLFVALVQTFIFTLLSCVYIGEVEANVAHHEHTHGHGDHHESSGDHAHEAAAH